MCEGGKQVRRVSLSFPFSSMPDKTTDPPFVLLVSGFALRVYLVLCIARTQYLLLSSESASSKEEGSGSKPSKRLLLVCSCAHPKICVLRNSFQPPPLIPFFLGSLAVLLVVEGGNRRRTSLVANVRWLDEPFSLSRLLTLARGIFSCWKSSTKKHIDRRSRFTEKIFFVGISKRATSVSFPPSRFPRLLSFDSVLIFACFFETFQGSTHTLLVSRISSS